MSEEDIDFLISIQDLEKTEFDNACLQRENKRLQKQLDFMIDRNDELQQENKQLKEKIDKANEFIRKHTKIIPFDEFGDDIADLLKILGDKE